MAQETLGGHLKTGHTWTLQNRPTERNQNKSIYTLRRGRSGKHFFAKRSGGLILTSPGRRIRQRRDATGAPTQRPEWLGAAQAAPASCHSGAKAINPRGLGTESPSKREHFIVFSAALIGIASVIVDQRKYGHRSHGNEQASATCRSSALYSQRRSRYEELPIRRDSPTSFRERNGWRLCATRTVSVEIGDNYPSPDGLRRLLRTSNRGRSVNLDDYQSGNLQRKRLQALFQTYDAETRSLINKSDSLTVISIDADSFGGLDLELSGGRPSPGVPRSVPRGKLARLFTWKR